MHCGDLYRSDPKECSRAVADVLAEALAHAGEGRTVLLLEDVDLLCPRRTEAAEKMSELRLLAAFTRQLDNAMTTTASEADLAIIATSSKSQEVDLAPLRRPGRLETEVSLAVPSNGERAEILRAIFERSHVLRGVPDISLADIADATPGFMGADLVLVVSKLEHEVKN